MPTPDDLRARARELLELADRMEADERRAAELTGVRREPITSGMDSTVSPVIHTGRKITSNGPVSLIALELGMSMGEIAREIGVKYATVKTQNHRGRLSPDVEKSLAALVKKRTAKK